MFRKHISALVVVLLFAPAVFSQTNKVADYVQAEMKRQHIPGLSLAIVKDGEVILAEGYGLSNVEAKVAAKPETVYKLCSVSKQFIATGIMLLVQEGRLGLDDPISSYLEETPATWKAITIRQLLTHTSGIVREAPGFDPFKIQSDAEVVKSAYSLPLRFAPGEKWEYCNTGYFALAEIIRKVSGRTWSEYLSEKVFKPSGMNATFPTNTKESLPNRSLGYSENDKLRKADDWPALRPSGAFLSTVLDMARWDAMLYTAKILSDSSRRQMWSPVKLNNGTSYPYGFGWQLGEFRGRKLVHHSGGMPGFRAKFARFIDDRLTIILLMNLDDADVDSILNGIAAFYLPASTPSRTQ
ncbi:MAG TPA: serine hydrolase domain-containing protein [Pyrinomonadaceae bacterium]|nr:serine hydrolase domain-containing protein [Pyrinomonadaceae bacterium]